MAIVYLETSIFAETLPKIYRLLTDMGHSPPLIVTPEEFSERD